MISCEENLIYLTDRGALSRQHEEVKLAPVQRNSEVTQEGVSVTQVVILPPEVPQLLAVDGLHPVVGKHEETLLLPLHLHQEAVVLVPLVAPRHPNVAAHRHRDPSL